MVGESGFLMEATVFAEISVEGVSKRFCGAWPWKWGLPSSLSGKRVLLTGDVHLHLDVEPKTITSEEGSEDRGSGERRAC